MQTLDAICEKLRLHELENITFIKSAADKVGIRAGYLALAILSFFSIFLIIEFGSVVLYYVLCIAYPMFMTFKAVEDIDTEKQNHWLAYWVVFSVILATDRVVSVFLSIIPMYGLLKVGVHVWLYSEKFKGAYYIYQKGLHPIFKKYESELDKKIQMVKEAAVKRLESSKSLPYPTESEKETKEDVKAKKDEVKDSKFKKDEVSKKADDKSFVRSKTSRDVTPEKATDRGSVPEKGKGHQKKPSTGDRLAELSKPKTTAKPDSSSTSPMKKGK
mmetsp:Transcript_45919/g.53106  ORF Transcript_45919/g.53106 Transcript_45919/m.53106 type:complete len:273 (+) Transcript_45919:24-842(+)